MDHPESGFRSGPFILAVIVDDILPLAGVGSCHDRDHRIGIAHVEHLLRDTWFDEDKAAMIGQDKFSLLPPYGQI